MAQIAASLGITSTALYRHFKNKGDLLEHCVVDELRYTVDTIGSPQGLDALIATGSRVALDRRGISALWQREARYLSPDAQLEVWRIVRGMERRVRAELLAARPELGEAAELLSWCMLAMFDSVSHHKVELPRARFEELLRDLGRRLTEVTLSEEHTFEPHEIVPLVPPPNSMLDEFSRRDRLLAAAARLFSSRGYHAVSIDDIGAASGITGPSVYYHFRSKSELLSELIQKGGEATDWYTKQALKEATTPLEACATMMSYYLSFASTHRELVWSIVSELTHVPDEESATHRSRQRSGFLRWAEALCSARPDLKSDEARVIVQAVIMIINDAVRLPELLQRPGLTSELSAIGMALQQP